MQNDLGPCVLLLSKFVYWVSQLDVLPPAFSADKQIRRSRMRDCFHRDAVILRYLVDFPVLQASGSETLSIANTDLLSHARTYTHETKCFIGSNDTVLSNPFART